VTETPRTWHHGLVALWWAEFNHAKPEELGFYRSAIERFGQPALDLGCGTGRIMLPLLEEGLDVDGIDVSEDMLSHARRRAAERGLAPMLLAQSFHELDPPRTYRTVYICDSFGIGGSRGHDCEMLRRVHGSLGAGGALVFSHDLPYADEAEWAAWLPARRGDLPRDWAEAGERNRLPDGTELELRNRLEVMDPGEQLVTFGIQARHWSGDELLASDELRIDIRLYFRQEILLMLGDAGFGPVAVQGYYTGQPATADDTSIIFIATRP